MAYMPFSFLISTLRFVCPKEAGICFGHKETRVMDSSDGNLTICPFRADMDGEIRAVQVTSRVVKKGWRLVQFSLEWRNGQIAPPRKGYYFSLIPAKERNITLFVINGLPMLFCWIEESQAGAGTLWQCIHAKRAANFI